MQLWQIDIVGGVMIADERTGELRETKVVTGVDDHSRFCLSPLSPSGPLPPALALAGSTGSPAPPAAPEHSSPRPWLGGPVEFDRVVPPWGNLWVAGRLFWLSPARAGMVVRFWADCQLIHLSAGGARIKTLRSHLSVADLAKLAVGAVPAVPSPLPPIEDGHAIEVERPVSSGGLVCLGRRLRHHPGHRAGRRRNPGRAPHHHHAGPQHQGRPRAASGRERPAGPRHRTRL